MIFLIADLHLNHTNIIKYCNRPFSSVEKMNSVIVNNWNKVVKKDDKVYLIGDLAFSKNGLKPKYWASKLNGTIILIRGNHDKDITGIYWKYRDRLYYNGYNFLLVHNPRNRGSWKDWMIHGHIHNGKLEKYPFINIERKTINVGAELLNYTPISIENLVKRIEMKMK